ncbi:hypothetical protein [Paeniglutamicibacter cryotolerans]|uniref:Aminoglycoside phosphotransferase domain-containing protein n=1 Tax=Paeniglutamicibacter cryotolerans TaxID=670079 RepID=A0A839QPS4_9MICC|nr:hypothetical protein [Paeniglutamicibacter cryotolerans]MBB2995986.1 hypothetical protein [Paeniglutamicibacter cryotolerans]
MAALSAALLDLGFEGDIQLARNRPGAKAVGFAVVPSIEKAILIVPTGSRRASAAALRRFSADLTGRQKLQRVAAATLFGLWGARSPLASHSLVPGSGTSQGIVEHLSGIFGEQVQISMGVGTLRANRKPILQVFSPRGRSLGFAKVGTNAFTSGLVDREGLALEELNDRTWKSLILPRVIHRGPWKEGSLLIMSGLSTSPVSAARGLERLRNDVQEELQSAYSTTSMPLANSSWFVELELAVNAGPPDSKPFHRLSRAIETLSRKFGELPVEFGMTHGDWTPWNMSVSKGKLQVWDWERFSTGVPVGFDEIHYSLHRHLRHAGLSARAVIDGARTPGTTSSVVPLAYLGELAARYLLGGQSLHVPAVELKAMALIEALETMVKE